MKGWLLSTALHIGSPMKRANGHWHTSSGLVTTTWHAPAVMPARISPATGRAPPPMACVRAPRIASLTVSLIVFSGATPRSWTPHPR
eukprot:scaffold8138_cov108-Isochrysis_galbana.AAC.2